MSASVAQSAAPTWAIKVWADDRSVYAELPSMNGPCVIAYPRSEGGLAKVLATLGAMHSSEGAGAAYVRPPYLRKELVAKGITNRDMEIARQTLEELFGMLKK